jgi:hypothetical protein
MNFKYLLNPRNYLKILYKPAKAFPTLKIYWRAFYNEVQIRTIQWKNAKLVSYDKKRDVKLKKISDKYILSIYKNSLLALERLHKYSGSNVLQIETIENVFGQGLEELGECISLGRLFTFYGSDKATTHNYYLIYYSLLHTKKQEPLQILEIGLGTNNIDVMSNMGRFGKPGASLRAFRDFLPNAYIYGADIDKRILFQEERINTLFIDQTNIEILYSVKESFGNKKFDLIIDDGLHNSEANLNSIDFALDLLSANGVLIIEDIAEKDFVYYKLLSKLFENKYQIRFIKTKIACVCYLTSVNSDIHSYNH